MLHLKMIVRSWLRNPLNTFISVTSLTTGLVCCIMLILFVLGEYRTAHSLGDTTGVYLLEEQSPFFSDKNIRSRNVSPYIAHDLQERFAEVEKTVMVHTIRWQFEGCVTEKNESGQIYETTPELCDLFAIPVLEGDLRSTLQSTSEVAVTNGLMMELYGRRARLGDRIMAKSGGKNWVNGVPDAVVTHDVVVTTILDDSRPLPMKYRMLTAAKPMDSQIQSYTGFYYTFIKLINKDAANRLQAKIVSDSLLMDNGGLFLRSFDDVYFTDPNKVETSRDGFIESRDPMLLGIGLSIALAILVIAAFNYINITMTRARSRLKNIAGQRIFGASKWAVRWQTVLDTTLLVALCFGLALVFIDSFTEQFNGFMQSKITLFDIFIWPNIVVVLGLLVVLIMLPCLYILARIEVSSPMETFKNPMGRKAQISSIMVVAQLVISIVLITVSINIARQMDYIATVRPGAQAILQLVNGNGQNIPADFADKVRALAFVTEHTTARPLPGGAVSSGSRLANLMDGDKALFSFYDIKFKEGRPFNDADNEENAIVNEAFLAAFDIKEPAQGQQVNFNGQHTIVGVVEDFVYADAHKKIDPLLIVYSQSKPGACYSLCVKTNGNTDANADELKALWKQMYPNSGDGTLEIKSVAQIYRDLHPSEKRLMTMVNIFMAISILLTALGLFGLAFYTVGRRTKEIALRKIHGSTTAQVILLLCRTFAIWTSVSFVIALPVAYYLSLQWLSDFAYRVEIVAWVFVLTALVAALVTFATVFFQTWSAARANPALSINIE